MPIYCYRREDNTGELVELPMTFDEHAERQTEDGRIRLSDGGWAKRDFHAERPGLEKTGDRNWPQHSDALGVHPAQRKEAHEESVQRGVPTHFDREGCPIFTSAGHKRSYMKGTQFFDRAAWC